MNEFEWEKFLKQSDERTDKFQRLFEKYIDHPNRDELIAREMGWNHQVAGESGSGSFSDFINGMEIPDDLLEPLEPNPETEGVDWVRDESGFIQHPLTRRIMDVCSRMTVLCKLKSERMSDPDVIEMLVQFQTTGAKVAGALDDLAFEDDMDGGFAVACLKRGLHHLHATLAYAEKVKEKRVVPVEYIESFKHVVFDVREEILKLMHRFRSDIK